MFQIKLSESTTARRRIPILLVDATDGYTPETGITTPTIKVSKNGGTQATGTGTFTEIGTGQYYYEFASGEIDTLGWVTFNLQKAGCRDYNAIVQIMAYDAMDAVRLGLTALPNANAASAGGLLTSGTGSHQINTSAGVVDANAIQISGDATAADNLESAADGTGYNLGAGQIVAQSVSGNVGGNVVGNVNGNVSGSVNSVTTGVSLASGAVTSSAIATGAITANKFAAGAITSTVIDSTANAAIADAVWDEAMSGHTTAGTYGGRIPRSDSSNVEVKLTGSAHIAADIHEVQPGTFVDADYAAGSTYAKLATLIEADPVSGYRYTAQALEEAPSGGGGGTTFATGNVPYQVKADEQFPGGVVDILVGTLLRLDLQVLDRDGNAINLTGATVTVGVRNASTGATVGSDQSASLSLARLGYITVDTVAAWSATAGTYRLTVSATVGSDVIVAGPLQLIVRAR
jgi:hypothetical protein